MINGLNFRLSRLLRSVAILCFSLLVMAACSSTPKYQYAEPTSGQVILESARLQLGERYKFGGKSPATGFDCSGLAWFSHKQNGINIPIHSSEQFKYGRPISKAGLKAGDLVFFETYRQGASHVGIYKGAGEFIHAPNRNKQVQIQVLSNSYYRKRYLGARRYW